MWRWFGVWVVSVWVVVGCAPRGQSASDVGVVPSPDGTAPATTAETTSPSAPVAPSASAPSPVVASKAWPLPPEDVQIKLSLVDPKAVYQQGEVVRVRLTFTTTRPGAYTVDLATYDRSGRLPSETFLVEPASDVVDPLAAYFESGGGMMGGGLRSIPTLEGGPLTVDRDLNEHVRFLKPGRYSLRVVTDRLSRESGGGFGPLIASDTVELTVVETDPSWASKALSQALAVLDDPSATDEAKGEAAQAIRHLGTDAAVEAMAARMVRGDRSVLFAFMFGLIGAPNRGLVVDALARQLVAPDAAIEGMTFRTLTLLDAALVAPLPGPYPGESSQDHPDVVAWRAREKIFRDAQEAANKRRAEQLDAALPTKTPASAAICVQALSELGWQRPDPMAASLEDPRLIAHFMDLPFDQKMHLLAYRWVRIGGEGIVGALQATLASPDTSRELYTVALSRLALLRPDEAKALLVAQVKSKHPKLSPFGMELLTAALPAVPDIDADLSALLASALGGAFDDSEVAAALVEQYASPKLAAQVKEALDRGDGGWSMPLQAHLLAYLLRVEEAEALKRVGPWIVANTYGLDRIAKRRWTPGLEAVAVGLLDKVNTTSATDIIRVLGQHGSGAVKDVLMEHLRRFSAQWSGRVGVLNDPKSDEGNAARALEDALWGALGKGQGWVLSTQEVAEVTALCLSDHAKDQVRFIRWFEGSEVSVWLWLHESDGALAGHVAHFDAKSVEDAIAKVQQFPVPTRFKIEIGGAPPDLTARAQETLSAAIRAAGHEVVPTEKP